MYRQCIYEQLAFERSTPDETTVVMVNGACDIASISVRSPVINGSYIDVLNDEQLFCADGERLTLPVSPCWGRILKRACHSS